MATLGRHTWPGVCAITHCFVGIPTSLVRSALAGCSCAGQIGSRAATSTAMWWIARQRLTALICRRK